MLCNSNSIVFYEYFLLRFYLKDFNFFNFTLIYHF